MTQDPLLVAGAFAAFELPWLLFSLPSGALVDRVDRRSAMVCTDLIRAGVVGVLAVLVVAGRAEIALICAVSFALSTAETVFDPAGEAILPLIVEADALADANARLQGTNAALNDFVGPPLGAALFALMAAAPFFIDAASFIASALIVLTLAGSYRAIPAGPRRPIFAEVGDGLRWLGRHPVLRYTAPLAGLTNVAGMVVFSILVLFSQEVLGLGDVGYGVLLGALGVGGLIGAFTAGMIIAAIGEAWSLRLPSWFGAVAALASVAVPQPIVVAVALATVGFSISLWNVAHVSLRQQVVPDELRGRIAGANKLISSGARPLGAVLGGIAAAAFGLKAPFILAAIILVAVGLIAVLRVTPGAIATARHAATSGPA
jgi:predicted MFS family arabinose efflux permease